MGVIIKATGLSTETALHDSVEHAVRAGSACINAAGIDKRDIGLVLNIGIYRNDNIFEPANAPFIQKGLGINLAYSEKAKTSFSFDILNGACGFMNAVQVAGAVLGSKKVKYALIVSSDVHPSRKKVADFPYRNMGAAALLEWSDDPLKGFQEILSRTSRNGSYGQEAFVDTSLSGAREQMNIRQSDKYFDHLIHFAAKTITDLYDEYRSKHDIRLADLTFLTSQPIRNFGNLVLQAAGMNGNPVSCLHDKYGNSHSSALTMAYHEAKASGQIKQGDQSVFIGAGDGLTVSAGLYIEP
ncbi:MAG: hypothetical protein KKD44_21650 [Proteobacteria bacterium]|nr:hypothetical protein [Pseudomonadota bacterium]